MGVTCYPHSPNSRTSYSTAIGRRPINSISISQDKCKVVNGIGISESGHHRCSYSGQQCSAGSVGQRALDRLRPGWAVANHWTVAGGGERGRGTAKCRAMSSAAGRAMALCDHGGLVRQGFRGVRLVPVAQAAWCAGSAWAGHRPAQHRMQPTRSARASRSLRVRLMPTLGA